MALFFRYLMVELWFTVLLLPFNLYIDLRRAVLFCDTAGSADFS